MTIATLYVWQKRMRRWSDAKLEQALACAGEPEDDNTVKWLALCRIEAARRGWPCPGITPPSRG